MTMEKQKKKSSAGKVVLIVLGVFFAIGMIANLTDDSSDSGKEAAAEEQLPSEVQPAPAEPVSNWNYRQGQDPMTSEVHYAAGTNSTNQLEFEFPYNGGSTGSLNIRNQGAGNEVLLGIDKGQFILSVLSSERVRVKFDDEAPLSVPYNSSADGSSNWIFLNGADKLIAKLKTAKKLMVEATFFDAGKQILYFDVEGFTWDK